MGRVPDIAAVAHAVAHQATHQTAAARLLADAARAPEMEMQPLYRYGRGLAGGDPSLIPPFHDPLMGVGERYAPPRISEYTRTAMDNIDAARGSFIGPVQAQEAVAQAREIANVLADQPMNQLMGLRKVRLALEDIIRLSATIEADTEIRHPMISQLIESVRADAQRNIDRIQRTDADGWLNFPDHAGLGRIATDMGIIEMLVNRHRP